jgi:exopolysaccharide production protein ExoZ
MSVAYPDPVPHRFNRLQALRGFAALAVFVSHLFEYQQSVFGWSLFPPGSGLGWFGVDIFFVLSGFIIARSSLKTSAGIASAIRFGAARAVRIYAPWWAALLATYGLVALAPSFLGYSGQAGIVANIFLLPDAEQPLLSVGWTLVMEMFFYAVFAVLLLVPQRLRTWALVIWAILIAGLALHTIRDLSPIARVAFNPLCLEFLLGVLVACNLKPPAKPMGQATVLTAFVLIFLALVLGAGLVSVWGGTLPPKQTEIVRVAAIGLPAALLVWLMAREDMASHFGDKTWQQWSIALGDRSYALYLVHYPIISAVAIGVASWSRSLDGMILFLALASVACVGATQMLHVFIERPAIKLSKRLRRGQSLSSSDVLRT